MLHTCWVNGEGTEKSIENSGEVGDMYIGKGRTYFIGLPGRAEHRIQQGQNGYSKLSKQLYDPFCSEKGCLKFINQIAKGGKRK